MSRLEPIRQSARLRKRAKGRRRWSLVQWLGLGGGGAAATLAAVLGYHAFRPGPGTQAGEQELIRDLRIIENKRYYDAVDNLDFLKQLDHPELFGEDDNGE
jgi:hypothetical protein